VWKTTSDYPAFERHRTKYVVTCFRLRRRDGQTYLQYREALGRDVVDRWIVQDLAHVIAKGQEKASRSKDYSPTFTEDLAACKNCNVFQAAGALHYWESSIAALLAALGSAPEHVINHSPFRSNGAVDEWEVAEKRLVFL